MSLQTEDGPTFRMETFKEKAWRKTKENPLVPISVAAVFYSFYMASVKMRQGQSLQMNYWLRARVGTQGVAILAISWSAGVWSRAFPNKDKEYPGWLGPLPNSALGVVEGEEATKMQFEERMKKAEQSHIAETGSSAPNFQNSAFAFVPQKTLSAEKNVDGAEKNPQGWWSWLKGGK